MLRITPIASAAAAAYYSQADYYGRDLIGNWGGRAAAALGLHGPVDSVSYQRLCANLHPATATPLTPVTRAARRVGYDFTFSGPKSVSVLYELTRDDRILDAFRAAVHEAMTHAEQFAATRVRKAGADADRTTANIVWAEYVHFTTRPVQGVPDPHLHAHLVTFNVTWDDTEQRWKAGQFGEIKRLGYYLEAYFEARLALRLRSLGYDITAQRKGWEVAGVPARVVREFSRRTTLIEQLAEKLGLQDAAARKAQLGATSREAKDGGAPLSADELRDRWRDRLRPEEYAALEETYRTAQARAGRPLADERQAAQEAVRFAVAHEFARHSTREDKRLLDTALRQATGKAGPEAVAQALDEAGLLWVHDGSRRLGTTRQVLEEERGLIQFVSGGRGRCKALRPGPYAFARDWLNEQQRGAVLHLLHSRDRVTAIRGVAGAGKSTLLQEAVAAVEATGRVVQVCAPTAEASRGELRKSGFAQATTLAALLANPALQAEITQGVVVVDEAGLVGAEDMNRLFALAAAQQARVWLIGDTRQHGPVARGNALEVLEKYSGLASYQVTEILRQQERFKDIAGQLAQGQPDRAFADLDALGWIKELAPEERVGQLAGDYLAAVRANQSALVIAPTHAEGREITEVIRARRRAQGDLDAAEHAFVRLEPLHWTEAERGQTESYQPGDVLQFFRHARGAKAGTRLVVTDPDLLPLDQARTFQVFRPAPLALAAGDRVRITANGWTKDRRHRLDNGALFTVAGFTPQGDVRLQENGWVVAKDFGHLAHGYVLTSVASQSKTVDRVFIGQADTSLPATDARQFYVSVTRARHQAVLYTEDKATLRAAVQRTGERPSATELVGQAAERATRWQRWHQHWQHLRRVVEATRTRLRDEWERTRTLLLEKGLTHELER